MTAVSTPPPSSDGSTDGPGRPTDRLGPARARIQPLLADIAAGVVQREQDHELPFDAVRTLVGAGFGRLRVPVEHGGDGLDLPGLAEILVDVAAADANLPQIFRGHIAWVEQLLTLSAEADRDYRDAWFARIVEGEFVGNSWSETGSGVTGKQQTIVRQEGGRIRIDGRKYYTTGSIFADWTDATARRTGPGQSADDDDLEVVTAIVRTRQPGVQISDDWNGFGQQLTGTGTIVFTDAEVDEADVRPFAERFRFQTALYQLVLLAVHAGIAEAVERDAGHEIRTRTRSYTHGLAPLVRHDAQVLNVVGEISSIAWTARQLVHGAAEALQGAADTAHDRDSVADQEANVLAEIRTAQAQTVLSETVPRAATLLFNTLGASGVGRDKDLDRHWRNARTVASHNPVIYKTRIVGDWSVNGTTPPFVWDIGTHASVAATQD